MRTFIRSRVFGAVTVAAALVLAACNGPGGDADSRINVASFNFPESVILAEIYAQAMEDRGYEVERSLNLGSRELIFADIESGSISFIPEYVGSAIAVGFGEEPPTDRDLAVQRLRELFAARDVLVLEPAPGEDKNVFVVTAGFANQNGVRTVSDLATVGEVTLSGPPECENRDTCYAGLVSSYGLDNLRFESIAEGSVRIAALEAGEIDVALLFSTQSVIADKGLVVLGGTEDLIAPENVIPVLSKATADVHGQELIDLINSISALITTEVLLDLNGRVEADAENPDDVARDWLVENRIIDG